MSGPARTAWLLVAPPAVLVGLRSVLELLAARQPPGLALPLTPVSAPGSLLELLWPAVAGLVLLAGLVWVVRQLGWRRVRPAAAVVWLLLWLAGSGALIQRHLNRQDLQPLPGVVAQTLASQVKPPSAHGVGGTQLYLQVPGFAVPRTVLIDDPQVAQLKPGDRLALQLAHGRFGGLFVTGWQLKPATAAASAASH